MKKLYFLIILASMAFLLASCAEKKVEPEPEPPPCEGADCEDAPVSYTHLTLTTICSV